MENVNQNYSSEKIFKIYFLVLMLIIIGIMNLSAQDLTDLYTARGYWEESRKSNYILLQQKVENEEKLNDNEKQYYQDYSQYLESYFAKLSSSEKLKYQEMKDQWSLALATDSDSDEQEFEWRTKDRALNSLYGIYYGASLAAIAEVEGGAAAGIPLITGGLWLMGPTFRPQKFEGITRNTIRMSNTGKLLGLGYGLALGATILDSDSYNFYKPMLALSSLGSIALGEIAFNYQKRHNLSSGQIELLRHYSIIGGWAGLTTALSTGSSKSNVYGGLVLAGGFIGTTVGLHEGRKYDYSKGDVYAINTLASAALGLGFAATIEIFESNDYFDESSSEWSFLIPAITPIIGTIVAQNQVQNIHLTRKQGSTLALSSAGSALLGLGIVAIAESDSPAMIIGLPSIGAIITHQIMLKNYDKVNRIAIGNKRGSDTQQGSRVSLNVSPENYWINQKKNDINDLYTNGGFEAAQSILALKFKF